MLPGFLTTALEIIIILDVCGAIAYFTITGLARMKEKNNTAPPVQNAGMPALAAEGMAMPALAPVPERITASVYDPSAQPQNKPAEPTPNQWTAGLKQRISSFTRKFTYKPAPNGTAVQTQNSNTEYAKLGRVLDSFKEDA